MKLVEARTVTEAAEHVSGGPRLKRALRKAVTEDTKQMRMLYQDVPIDDYYCILPLLREVKQQDLPRAVGEGGKPFGHDSDGGVRRPLIDIRRWEEELLGREIRYELIELDAMLRDFRSIVKDAASAVPRFVVVGPPGSGKSTLTQHLAQRAATKRLHLGVEDGEPIPVRLSLVEWENSAPRATLPEHLASLGIGLLKQSNLCRDDARCPCAKQWAEWLDQGRVFILLDGLDELELKTNFESVLRQALSGWPRCPLVITCRTVSFEMHRRLCGMMPVFALGPLEREQQLQFIDRFPTRDGKAFDAGALKHQLDRLPQLEPLWANPLLLSMICFVFADKHPRQGLPETRGELYDRAVDKLLQVGRDGSTEARSTTGLSVPRRRWVLERAALELFEQSAQRDLVFNEAELIRALGVGIKANGVADWGPVADQLGRELVQESRLLLGRLGGRYFSFLHPTFHEFLAAAALGEWINDHGWKKKPPVGHDIPSSTTLVDERAWNQRWREVLLLLAGQLKDVRPLLKLLSDLKKESITHDRLALAGQCLTEIKEIDREPLADFASTIASRTLDQWLEHAQRSTYSFVESFKSSLPSLGQVNPDVGGVRFCDRLAQLLQDPDDKTRYAAVEIVGGLGIAATQYPTLLNRLFDLLRDRRMQSAAAEALRRVGNTAVQHRLLNRLADLLCDGNQDVRWSAAGIIRKMANAAGQHPAFLDRLAELLRDPDGNMPRSAVETVAEAMEGVSSAAAQHPALLNRLTELLSDPNREVRWAAARALRRVGSAASQHPALLEALVKLLTDLDPGVRWAASDALRRVGTAVGGYPGLLNRLVELLQATDRGVRTAAADVLRGTGSAAAQHPALLDHLVGLLQDLDEGVRTAAADALRGTGSAAAQHPALLDRLAQLLRDPDRDVRRAAAATVEAVGNAAAEHPTVLDRLTELLGDTDDVVRGTAASAAGALGSAATQRPILLCRLADGLRDPNWGVREATVRALGLAATRHPTLLDRLAEGLSDVNWRVREATIRALGEAGPATAQHPSLPDRLVQGLRDESWEVATTSAQVAGALCRAGVQHPTLLDRLAELLRDPHRSIRESAVRAVREVRRTVAQYPAFLDHLAELLCSDDKGVREAAIDAVSAVGGAAATRPALLDRLIELLRDDDEGVRRAAASAVTIVCGEAAQHSALLNRLTKLLGDRDRGVRQAAVEAVGAVGSAAAQHPALLNRLTRLLHDRDRGVRRAAAEAVGAVGSAATQHPDLLNRLTGLLRDHDWGVRSEAATAVVSLADEGVRIRLHKFG